MDMAGGSRKRKSVASSSSRAIDVVQFANADQKKRYEEHMKRTHIGTRWYHGASMQALGLQDEIPRLMATIGADTLLSMQYPSYPALTSELLSTFKMEKKSVWDSRVTITFRLGNEEFEIGMKDLNGFLSFPENCDDHKVTTKDLKHFWLHLTGRSDYSMSSSSSVDIVHPAFCIIQRLLGNTIYARSECTKLRQGEPICLWCMVHKRPIDLAVEVASKLVSLSVTTKGPIHIGGLIARLADSCNIDLSKYSSIPPDQYVDLAHLKSSGIIQGDVSSYTLKINQIGRFKPFRDGPVSTENRVDWYESWVGSPTPHRDDEREDNEMADDAPEDGLMGDSSHHEHGGASLDEQIFSLHQDMKDLRTHVDDRFSEVFRRLDFQDHLQKQIYYHVTGHLYDHDAPFPPPPT